MYVLQNSILKYNNNVIVNYSMYFIFNIIAFWYIICVKDFPPVYERCTWLGVLGARSHSRYFHPYNLPTRTCTPFSSSLRFVFSHFLPFFERARILPLPIKFIIFLYYFPKIFRCFNFRKWNWFHEF